MKINKNKIIKLYNAIFIVIFQFEIKIMQLELKKKNLSYFN